MSDVPENDPDTVTELDLESMYGGRFLSSSDLGDRKVRTTIQKVRKEELRKEDGTKRWRLVLSLAAFDKPMVVNATIKDLLVASLGRVPSQWVNASVGVFVDPNVMFAGKRVGGLRLRVLQAFQAKPKPAPKPAPAPKKPAATAWPEEEGDPGFNPDDVPDFDEAAE
jgi:hypothetical protein